MNTYKVILTVEVQANTHGEAASDMEVAVRGGDLEEIVRRVRNAQAGNDSLDNISRDFAADLRDRKAQTVIIDVSTKRL